MKLLVCGDRRLVDAALVSGSIEEETSGCGRLFVIVGDSRGADNLARRWALDHADSFEEFEADWWRFGKRAGPMRNQRMIDEGKPDRALAFWDGKSPGTKDMITRAVHAGVAVRIVPVRFP